MKSLITFINEKQNFLIKGHTKSQNSIDVNKLANGPVYYNDIKIYIEERQKDAWNKFEFKREMFNYVEEILRYVEPNVISSMSWYYGNNATLTLKKNYKQNIGWLSYHEQKKYIFFADWELNMDLCSNTDGIEKIAEEINKLGK